MGALCCCFAADDDDGPLPAQPQNAVVDFPSPAPTEDVWMISCGNCNTKLMKQYPTTTCVHCGNKMVTDELPVMSL